MITHNPIGTLNAIGSHAMLALQWLDPSNCVLQQAGDLHLVVSFLHLSRNAKSLFYYLHGTNEGSCLQPQKPLLDNADPWAIDP